MLWVLGGVGALWLAFVSPSFRKVALAIIGLVAIIGLWLYFTEEKKEVASRALDTVIPTARWYSATSACKTTMVQRS